MARTERSGAWIFGDSGLFLRNLHCQDSRDYEMVSSQAATLTTLIRATCFSLRAWRAYEGHRVKNADDCDNDNDYLNSNNNKKNTTTTTTTTTTTRSSSSSSSGRRGSCLKMIQFIKTQMTRDETHARDAYDKRVYTQLSAVSTVFYHDRHCFRLLRLNCLLLAADP